jgi:hypothetical protein
MGQNLKAFADTLERFHMMEETTILFPVCGVLYPYRLDHDSFWLARHLSARLYLVEVLLPAAGWMWWLVNQFRNNDREWRLRQVEKVVFQQDRIPCETETVEVPNLCIGIAEAAWRVKPNYVALTPELQDRLGTVGLKDLRTRLSEVGRCMLILFGKGPALRLEPCSPTESASAGQVIRVKFD